MEGSSRAAAGGALPPPPPPPPPPLLLLLLPPACSSLVAAPLVALAVGQSHCMACTVAAAAAPLVGEEGEKEAVVHPLGVQVEAELLHMTHWGKGAMAGQGRETIWPSYPGPQSTGRAVKVARPQSTPKRKLQEVILCRLAVLGAV